MQIQKHSGGMCVNVPPACSTSLHQQICHVLQEAKASSSSIYNNQNSASERGNSLERMKPSTVSLHGHNIELTVCLRKHF